MLLTPPTSEEAPHIAALLLAVDARFQFLHFSEAIYAERWCSSGVVETIALRGMSEAVAARIRVEDYPHGDPLWQEIGTVAEVIDALLALPPHGHPGAPMLARHASSSLLLPGDF
ncbi:hypothetical protein [Saccharopolyspora pogona]|uniref:hypothetical protein n=1 Tax=Saccharopolyspora pogona TaxID=333966 RepID=UPI001686DC86|nr:hypothetical protein [Saccharopolyspora pogona]